MHLNDGQLRASNDHEADANVITHLASCAECRRRADEMNAQSQRTTAHFDALLPQDSNEMSAHMALARLKARKTEGQKENGMNRIFNRRNRTAWSMLGIVALLVISFMLPPVQTWAEGVLAQFRVKSIVVIPVDASGLQGVNNNSTLVRQVSQLVSDSTQVTKEAGKPQNAANASDASKLAGFTVRLPLNQTSAPQISVSTGSAFEFVVNRARSQSLLNEAGFTSAQLPASIDKANIKVSIPASVMARYGDCGKPDATPPQPASKNCVVVSQMPSPTVDTPASVDLAQLAEIGLQLAGMTKDQAHSFAQNIDWTSTLVVPIPRNGATYTEVQVDGVKGNLIETQSYGFGYSLVWIKNGIIYMIDGTGDSANARTLGNAMK